MSASRASNENQIETDRVDNPAGFRRKWFETVVDVLQSLAGRPMWFGLADEQLRLADIVKRLPPPETPLERLMLRATLWESALRLGAAVHQDTHRRGRVRCTLNESALLLESFARDSTDPREAFQNWLELFFEALRAAHPLANLDRVAGLIRKRQDRPLDLDGLAREARMAPGTLRREFCRAFGRTPKEYHCALRLLSAIERIGTDKIESVALDAGYRSRKNFYAMFRKLTGLTPAQFRRLPAGKQDVVLARARHIATDPGYRRRGGP